MCLLYTNCFVRIIWAYWKLFFSRSQKKNRPLSRPPPPQPYIQDPRSASPLTTAVLKKPDKPNYELPKAWHLITLLCTIPKVLTALVVESISHLVEKNTLLPDTHFGGRPGRTMRDTIHYLVSKIKSVWGKKKVTSVLILDVEGAFPNAVTDRLIHNLRKQWIPTAYVKFIERLLKGRKTKLKFDNFISELINITNGIGQGNPISMLLYILYNMDLLEALRCLDKDAVGYMDNALVIATAKTLKGMTRMLKTFMEKRGRGFDWAHDHNSNFEISKVTVMHCQPRARKPTNRPNPVLRLRGRVIKEVDIYKYLGVHIDSQLRWKIQENGAIAKVTSYILNFHRLTHTKLGIRPRLMRLLFVSVAILKNDIRAGCLVCTSAQGGHAKQQQVTESAESHG
jgi:hypothetical protein